MKILEKETTTTGGKSMINEYTRHNVSFGKPELNGGVLNFCGLLNNEPLHGVKIIKSESKRRKCVSNYYFSVDFISIKNCTT